VRLDKIMPEYLGRVKVRERPFPLEVFTNEPPSRDELEQEKWLAALQEPLAEFRPYDNTDFPTSTLPAFEAAWCAFRQGQSLGHDYDLRIRRAFFAHSRNIARRDVLIELAEEAGLDVPRFTRQFDGGEARQHILREGQLGRDHYRVRGTPTLMMADGTKLHHPIAYSRMEKGKIVQVARLPCCGEGCLAITRTFFEKALQPVAEQR
jgi:predicted DsbA family dithiol-disulfide isomerase